MNQATAMQATDDEQGIAASGATTLIAADTIVRGEIRGRGKTVALGQIVGDCDVAGPVTVAVGGHWRGKLKVDSLTVAGTVEGDIIAKSTVQIEPTGKVTGTITSAALRVASGAVVNGQVTVLSECS